jgi:hypothetical protein
MTLVIYHARPQKTITKKMNADYLSALKSKFVSANYNDLRPVGKD